MPDAMQDPVCGMEIEIHQAVASVVTEGRRYFFCCPRCHAAFLDTPHRYVGWAEDPTGPLPALVATGVRSNFESCRFAS